MKKKVFLLILLMALNLMLSSVVSAHENHEFYDLVDSHGTVMIFIDPENGKIVYANKAAADFYGYSKVDLEIMDVYDLRVSTDHTEIPRWDELSNRSRNTYTVEHRIADGSVKTIHVKSYPFEYEGEVVLFSILEDITPRIMLEESTKRKTDIMIAGALVSIAFLLYLAESRRKVNYDMIDVNNLLIQNKDQLQLILDSTAEGIYGMDTSGLCTFCNESGIRLLGYENQEELIGKNIHDMIHHTYRDGSKMSAESCKILKAINEGIGVYVDDEVFWRKDGSSFDVEYNSHPQFKDGRVVGGVVTFNDITSRKSIEEKVRYLSFHDSVTGLYNKLFFNEELKRLDVERNLPISVIVGDINGLKLTNDLLGHDAGDNLIRSVGEVLREVCRADDIIARTGGDEFIILLPGTGLEDAQMISKRIKETLSGRKVNLIKGSISTGAASKEKSHQDMEEVLKLADERMYYEKTITTSKVSNELLGGLMDTLYERFPEEKQHAEETVRISGLIGKALNLRPEVLKKLKDAAFYHDIGKVVLSKEGQEDGSSYEMDLKEIEQHSIVGFRILNLFAETVNLAEIVFAHHESWDGKGYPKGLKGIEIPVLSRIIHLSEEYESMVSENGESMSKKEALQRIRERSGIRFDPMVVKAFIGIEDKI